MVNTKPIYLLTLLNKLNTYPSGISVMVGHLHPLWYNTIMKKVRHGEYMNQSTYHSESFIVGNKYSLYIYIYIHIKRMSNTSNYIYTYTSGLCIIAGP